MCNAQYVLIYMVEEWKENLDKSFLVGAVLTALSKAFDCIPYELLIAKPSAYGLTLIRFSTRFEISQAMYSNK